jgi:hypothetical protein
MENNEENHDYIICPYYYPTLYFSVIFQIFLSVYKCIFLKIEFSAFIVLLSALLSKFTTVISVYISSLKQTLIKRIHVLK